MLSNGMHPQSGLIVDENGQIHSLVKLLKDIGSGGGGSMIELQKGETHIQWKYSNEQEWKDLVPLQDLKGQTGAKGTKGDVGPQGPAGTPGFPSEQQWNELVARVTALENPSA